MKAYLIDPTAQTVSQVEYDGNYKSIYKLIDCDTFTTVLLADDNDAIFVDDEGLLKDEPGPFFNLKGYPQPLAGKGLVLGADNEGESVEPTATLDQIKDMISFEQPAVPPQPGFRVYTF